MARKLRIQYPGAIYHVMNRGDRREPIFLDDADRRGFLQTWRSVRKDLVADPRLLPDGESFSSGSRDTTAQPLRRDEVAAADLYGRFNRKHRFFGHVFSGRFKAPLVDGSDNGYLRTG